MTLKQTRALLAKTIKERSTINSRNHEATIQRHWYTCKIDYLMEQIETLQFKVSAKVKM